MPPMLANIRLLRFKELQRVQASLTKINDELDNLETGDPLLPPDANATSTLEVVPVHNNVDSQVKGDGNPRNRGRANQLSVAEKSRSTVVVAMEESCREKYVSDISSQLRAQLRVHTERLLLQEEEDGVEQLEVLGQVVELHQKLA